MGSLFFVSLKRFLYLSIFTGIFDLHESKFFLGYFENLHFFLIESQICMPAESFLSIFKRKKKKSVIFVFKIYPE